ncbi:formate dehydrogenase subunit gamma [Brachymonas chironomi]|uniref:formate dehydrogenase subunit gamma n=1 Tax=Brachymonas chironomi TaxID=491919 RepID=UPI0003AA7B56|nr:formate dehydrogenase subunit gamma [Brachymonas chironomi]
MMKRYLQRYGSMMRFNHWIMVLLFGLAGFSGLALFHPSLFFLDNLFGGPQWTRILHPYLGVGVFIAFLFMFFALARANLFNRNDVEWMKKSGDMLAGRKANMPPAGRFNAGQKGVFWVMAICMLLLLVTGVLFWQQWFANSVPIPLQRVALVVHALSAFAISLVVVMHIYAALWVKGTVRAMTQGTVSAGWAKQNHYLWYKKVTGEGADKR